MPAGFPASPVLGRIDPFGKLRLAGDVMPELLSEVDTLIRAARPSSGQ